MAAMTENLLRHMDQAQAEYHATGEVRDIGHAEYAARKLAHLKAQAAEVERAAAEQIRLVEAWRDAELSRLQPDIDFRQSQLVGYLQWLQEQEDAPKSIRLPHATIKSIRQQPKVEYDESVVLAWAVEQGREDLVRVKREVNKSAVKEAVLKDGEAVPGVTVLPAEIKYSVDVEVQS